MTNNLPANIPSLARAFAPERDNLRQMIIDEGLGSEKAVRAARLALERAGERFAGQCEDINLQRSGLWLLEMVKSGAGVLDRASSADIIWREVPNKNTRRIAGSTLFYGAALVFLIAGFVQGSSLTILAAIILAALRFFDPADLKNFIRKIPFFTGKNQNRLMAPNGSNWQAEAKISVQASGFTDALMDALKTADHILAQISEPQTEYNWSDDKRLLGIVQSLLEAKSAGDSGFAMKLIDSELKSLLGSDAIEIINYSKKTANMFDILPALDMKAGTIKQAAPALVKNGHLLKRGTVWKA